MNICGGHQLCPRLVFVGPNFSYQKSLLGFCIRRISISPLVLKDDALSKFLTKAASVSPSSPAEFPELMGQKPKEKKRRIVGIDQEELLDPTVLADPESCFCEFNGVQIHHKICDAESLDEVSLIAEKSGQRKNIGLPMILLHGFGASIFSWDRVLKPLAQIIGSKVLAFDRPAFGLTSRVDPSVHSTLSEDAKPLNPYSALFSVLATLHFMDSLASEKAILVGHSAGALVAVDTYFKAPERVAAMILVAPAILAPLVTKKASSGRSNKTEEQLSESKNHTNLFIQLLSILANLTKFIVQAIANILKGMGDIINLLYKRAFSAVLRSAVGVVLVRMIIDKFGIAAVKNAWFDPNQANDHVLQGYTKPLRVKGWDRALVEYTIAMLTDTSSQSNPSRADRLSEITCPVLVVTGDTDRLVPSSNSRRLSEAIPGSQYEIFKNCGHLPHEEKVEEFISVVYKFLQTVFGAAEEQCVQALS